MCIFSLCNTYDSRLKWVTSFQVRDLNVWRHDIYCAQARLLEDLCLMLIALVFIGQLWCGKHYGVLLCWNVLYKLLFNHNTLWMFLFILATLAPICLLIIKEESAYRCALRLLAKVSFKLRRRTGCLRFRKWIVGYIRESITRRNINWVPRKAHPWNYNQNWNILIRNKNVLGMPLDWHVEHCSCHLLPERAPPKHEYRGPTLRPPCGVIDDVITMKIPFFA